MQKWSIRRNLTPYFLRKHGTADLFKAILHRKLKTRFFSMQKQIPTGLSNFAKLIRKNYLFVDKSLFIKTIFEDASESILIARPRRWGKTLNMSMLHHFLSPIVSGENTQGLFDQCQITQQFPDFVKEHQAQYPVIFVTFKEVKAENFEEALSLIRQIIRKLYQEHEYLIHSDKLNDYDKQFINKYLTTSANQAELTISLQNLTQVLHKHFGKKVYVLIDEYDTPLNAAYSHYLDEMTYLIKGLLGSVLKDNNYLEKGIMTGIMRLSRSSMLSDLNNLEIYTTLTDRIYKQCFGFTDTELNTLFAEVDFTLDKNQIKNWYNGYNIEDVTLYNPYSIIQCLKNKGEIGPYWIETGKDHLLKTAFLNSSRGAKEQFQSLISTESIAPVPPVIIDECVRFDALDKDDTALWSLLLASGYVKYLEKERVPTGYKCKLAIPNQEVRWTYTDIFSKWLEERLGADDYRSFVHHLVTGHIEEFAKHLNNYLVRHTSFFDFKYESNYQTFVLGLMCSITDFYYLYSNLESGDGRPDIILIPKDKNKKLGLILEFKRAEDIKDQEQLAQKALDQIDAKKYAGFIGQYSYITEILKVGAAFLDKTVITYYRLDDLENRPLSEMAYTQQVSRYDLQ